MEIKTEEKTTVQGRNPLQALQGNSAASPSTSRNNNNVGANSYASVRAKSDRQGNDSTKMTAMARMRYSQKKTTTNTSSSKSNSSTPSRPSKDKDISSVASGESIQKQKRRKWRRRQLQASREEAEMIYGKGKKTVKSGGEDNDELINVDDCGVDLSLMAKPITDALYNVTQSIFVDAFMGKECSMLEGKECGILDESFSDTYSEFSGSESGSSIGTDVDDNVYQSEISDDDTTNTEKRRGRERSNGGTNKLYTNSDPALKTNIDKSSPNQGGVGLKAFLEEIKTGGIQLKMHHAQISGFTNRWSNVQAYIHINNSEGGEMIEPNFVWKDIDASKTDEKRKKISLFDISSVQKAADSINLQAYPYANPAHSLVITLHNGNIRLFEAEDEVVVKRVIHGLRWIVARLSFSLIVGNREVCAELLPFSSTGGCNNSSRLPFKIMNDITDCLVEKSAQRLERDRLIQRKM